MVLVMLLSERNRLELGTTKPANGNIYACMDSVVAAEGGTSNYSTDVGANNASRWRLRLSTDFTD